MIVACLLAFWHANFKFVSTCWSFGLEAFDARWCGWLTFPLDVEGEQFILHITRGGFVNQVVLEYFKT